MRTGGTEVQVHPFLTSALDGGMWPNHAPTALSRERTLVSTDQEAGGAPTQPGRFGKKGKSLVFAGIRNLGRPAHILLHRRRNLGSPIFKIQ